MLKTLFFLLIVFSMLSCHKGTASFTIKGNVHDNTFDKSLDGAIIKLYQVPVGSTDKQLVQSSMVQSDGSYTFTFPREKMEKYIIAVTKFGYFDVEEIIFFSECSISSDNIRDLSTTAKSWAKLTFHNVSALPTDHLQYIKQNGKENCTDCCASTYQDYFGALDTSIYCINDGNTTYSYMYWVLGTSNQGVKSIITNAFDTTEIILSY